MLPETGVVVSVTSTKSPRMPLATIEMIFPARKVMYGKYGRLIFLAMAIPFVLAVPFV